MTHGVGSLSGGGGGFGFTHVGHSTGSRRNSSSSDVANWVSFCGDLCTLLGFLFCLKKMQKKHRLILLWVWVISITVATAVAISAGAYREKTISASPTDMRKVSRGISTVFCQGETLTSSSVIDAYLLPNEPVVNQHNRQNFSTSKTTHVRSQTYEYWGFYLLNGSNITVESCAWDVDMYVIKGYDNFDNWVKDNSCLCYLKHRFINCIFPFYKDIYHLQVDDSDDYFFVYANADVSGQKELSVDFKLDRSLYDVTNATKRCISRHCSFNLDLSSSQTVVFQTPPSFLDDINVYTSCMHRPVMFVVMFLIIPVVIGAFATCIIHVYYKNRASASSSSSSSGSQNLNINSRSYGGLERSLPPMGVAPPSDVEATTYQNY